MKERVKTSRSFEEVEREIDRQFEIDFDESLLSQNSFSLVIYLLSIVFVLYHLWYAVTSTTVPRPKFTVVHLAFILVFWSLFQYEHATWASLRGRIIKIGCIVYILLTVSTHYYLYENYLDILRYRAGIYNNTDILVGAIVIGLVLLAIWSVSRLIFIISFGGIIYAYFGEFFPGVLNHGGLLPRRIISMNTVEFTGIFGPLLQITATWVLAFLVLAAFIELYGGMATFVKGATRLVSRTKYLQIGQVAVLASMAMGSVNGSTAANTATTGAFTIPLMKENGYRPSLAAAIESVASSGGQVLPPIMGAGAFLMAEIIEPSYAEIVVASAVSSLLFFATVAISINLNASGVGSIDMTLVEKRSVPQFIIDVGRHTEYLIMFCILLYYLIIRQIDPMLAGFYGTLSLAAMRLIRLQIFDRGSDDSSIDQVKLFGRETIEAMKRSAEFAIDVSIILASLGIIIRAFIVTGFAQRLSTLLVIIGGDFEPLLLLVAMAAAIVFGMGMSTGAAYLLVAILVAPALTTSGIPALTAHLYVFYFAVVSNITPPIALAVAIAHGIADADFWASSLEALKIGFPMFLLPFAFFYNPSLLYVGTLTIITAPLILLGFISMSLAFAGGWAREMILPVRLLFTLGGVFMIFTPAIVNSESLVLSIQLILAFLIVLGIVFHSKIAKFPLQKSLIK